MYTLRKIEESRFFLNQLKSCGVTSAEFCFYFSATVAAIRSVTFAMQKEYRHKSGFDEQYALLQENLKADAFAASLVQSRNISQKIGSLVPITVYRVTNLDTNEEFTWELDGVPFPDNQYFGFRIQRNAPCANSVVSVDPDDKNQILEAAATGFIGSIHALNTTTNKTVTCQIKLEPTGNEYELGMFFDLVRSLLDTLMHHALLFQSQWPARSIREMPRLQ
jgi:hypothetical protein